MYRPAADVQKWIKGEPNPVATRILFVLDELFVLRGQDPPAVIAIPRAEVMKVSQPKGD